MGGENGEQRIRPGMRDESDARVRASRLRERIAAKGLTLAEFARQAGLTRNVMYGLGKGKLPKPSEKARMDAILGLDP